MTRRSGSKHAKGGAYFTRDALIVLEEKLHRGRCAYHPKYNNGAEHLVTIHNHVEFAFDHIDRKHKTMTIAKLVGRYATPQRIITEMAKCLLTCHNCHVRKTIDNNDHTNKPAIPNHPGLFDA